MEKHNSVGRELLKTNSMIVPLWRRVFAYIIDLLIISIVVYLPIGNMFGEEPGGDFEAILSQFGQSQEFTFEVFMISFVVALLSVLYWALLEFKLGQSVGKMAMGIKVVDIDGKKLQFGQCFMRSITKMSTFILFLDVLYGIFKKDYRRYFEVITNTNVVGTNGSF